MLLSYKHVHLQAQQRLQEEGCVVEFNLIFDGFEPMTAAPCSHDEHDLNLSSDHAQEIAPVTVLALVLEQIAPSGDRG